MTAVTKGFASRLGFGVGRTLRFFLNDRNVGLRWVKRGLLGAALLVVFLSSFSWLLGSLLTLGCLGLGLFTLVKGDGSLLDGSTSADGTDEDYSTHPNRGEYDNPNYYLYYKD